MLKEERGKKDDSLLLDSEGTSTQRTDSLYRILSKVH